MGVVYSITNQKGGVGKTTTSLCLGSAIAEQGYKVLLVDFDPQAGLTVSLGYDPDSFFQKNQFIIHLLTASSIH